MAKRVTEDEEKFLERLMTRREAISTIAKAGAAAGVGLIVGAGATAAYYSTLPAKETKETVTKTETATKTVTQTAAPTTVVTTAPTTVVTTAAPFELPDLTGVELHSVGPLGHPASTGVEKMGTIFEELTGCKIVHTEYSWEDFMVKGTMDLITQHSGTWDVYCVDRQWVGPWYRGLVNLNDYRASHPDEVDPNYDESDWTTLAKMCSQWVHGERLAFPYNYEPTFLTYRSDLFNDSNNKAEFKEKYNYDLPVPPTTWAQFYDCGEFFTKGDGENFGIAGMNDTPFFGIIYTSALGAWRNKPEVLDKFGPIHPIWGCYFSNPDVVGGPPIAVTGEPGAIDVMKYAISLTDFEPSPLESGYPEATSYFAKGMCAMLIGFSAQYWECATLESSNVRGKCAPAEMPEHWNIVGGQGLSMNKDSKQQKAAFAFIQWYTNKENMIKSFELAGTTPNRYSSFAPEVVAKYEAEGRPELAAFLRVGAEMQKWFAGSGSFPGAWDKTAYPILQYIQQALHGTITPEEAAAKGVEEVNPVTKEIYEELLAG